MTSVTRGSYDLRKKTSPIIGSGAVSWNFILAGKREKITTSLPLYFFVDGGTSTQSVVYSAVLPFSVFHLLKAFGEGECFEAFLPCMFVSFYRAIFFFALFFLLFFF